MIRMIPNGHIVFAVILVCLAEYSGAQGLLKTGCANQKQASKVLLSKSEIDNPSATKCSNQCQTKYIGTMKKQCWCFKVEPKLLKTCENKNKKFTIFCTECSTTEITAYTENTSEKTHSTLDPQSYNETSTESTTYINVTEMNISNSTSKVDSTASTTQALCSSTTCYTGCFKPKSVLQKFNIKENPDRQVIDCMVKCTKSRYVGIQIQEESDKSLWCHCLGNDLANSKWKRIDKCNRTCSGNKGLPCGGKNKLISVYRRVNQSPGDVKYQKPPPAGVELYILITIVSLIGFTCLCALSVFGVRKWKQYQESHEYDDDHYYTYCQVPCNEMATSCSIEGSSNVTYLKNYPAKLPPPRKINRHSIANEASISEQVIPESDELEVNDIEKGEGKKEEVIENNADANEQYFILEPKSFQKRDNIEDSFGYLTPKSQKPESNFQKDDGKPNISPSNDESYSVLETYKTDDEQCKNKLCNAVETNSSEKCVRSNDYDQQNVDGVYIVLEKEIDGDKISSENS